MDLACTNGIKVPEKTEVNNFESDTNKTATVSPDISVNLTDRIAKETQDSVIVPKLEFPATL